MSSAILTSGPALLAACAAFALGGAGWWIAKLRRELRTVSKSERRFRMLFEQSPDAMTLFEFEGATLIDGNEAALRLLRCEREWALGRHPWDFSPQVQPDGAPSLHKAQELIEQVKNGGSSRFEWEHTRADGTVFPAEIFLTGIQLAGQSVVLGVMRDITAYKEARAEIERVNAQLEQRVEERTAELAQQEKQMDALAESESRFRLLFDRSPDALLLFDSSSGLFVDCNEATFRLLRCDREWLIGKSPWEVSPVMQPEGISSEQKAVVVTDTVSRQGWHRFEWRHMRADSTEFPAEISVTAVEISTQPLWVCVIGDITEQKAAEEARREAQRTLERRVIERTAELASTNEQLQRVEADLRRALTAERELSELKSNFVSMVSHEFRTPLGIIGSSAQILERYLERLDQAGRMEHIGAILQAVQRMAGMMENVLVLSRVDRGRLDFTPAAVRLDEFCACLIDELRSSTGMTRAVEFECEPGLPVANADMGLLRHILGNLLSNAVKYSPEAASARLTLTRDEFEAVFTVEDHGIGIPAADQGRLFDTFHRGSNVGHVAGTGLGLVIVKRCCDLHGGDIRFQSAEGRGTTFTVRLPVFCISPTHAVA